jgi:hypothetical protein
VGATILLGSGAQLTLNADGSFSYTPGTNFNGTDSFTYRANDGTMSSGLATVTITVTPVNDAPLPGSNLFTISNGGTLGIAAANLSATDVDNSPGALVFSLSGITHGRFELTFAPGAAITSFTQQQILNREVRFVHDGSGLAPTFAILVTDGAAGVGPFAANITFNPGGFTPKSPPGGGSTVAATTTEAPTVTQPAPPAPASIARGVGGQAGLRPPANLAGGGEVEDVGSVIVTQSAPGAALAKLLAAEAQTLPIRAQAEVLETIPSRTQIDVEPIQAEIRTLPIGQQLAQADEEKQRMEVVLGTVKITGLALSVGAVWWAARAAGLIASLLASAPAWRHLDPLPVLGRDDEEDEEIEAGDQDEAGKEEEHRVGWVLDDRSAQS